MPDTPRHDAATHSWDRVTERSGIPSQRRTRPERPKSPLPNLLLRSFSCLPPGVAGVMNRLDSRFS